MKKDNHPISLRVSEEILTAINEHREDTPLTHWLRDAINLKLQTEKGSMLAPSDTTNKTTLELQERLSSIEARLSELEGKKIPPKEKPTQTVELVTSPELKPINGVVSHKVYRNEIDSFVMELVKTGKTLQAICDHLNNLGWLTTRGEPWTRNSVGAIPRRLKGKG
tara:strand:+ start:1619 stop:2116 length:498 start_codon:yes stop_codon:yes gene_type:complete